MPNNCLICDRIAMIGDGANPYFVAELPTGYAVLADNQLYRGYTIFLSKLCVPELHLLGDAREPFLRDMAVVAEAVFAAFAPVKLNYELLGNSERHLHWHLTPRHADDPLPTWPIWNNPAFLGRPHRPDEAALTASKRALLAALDAAGAELLRRG